MRQAVEIGVFCYITILTQKIRRPLNLCKPYKSQILQFSGHYELQRLGYGLNWVKKFLGR